MDLAYFKWASRVSLVLQVALMCNVLYILTAAASEISDLRPGRPVHLLMMINIMKISCTLILNIKDQVTRFWIN